MKVGIMEGLNRSDSKPLAVEIRFYLHILTPFVTAKNLFCEGLAVGTEFRIIHQCLGSLLKS